MISHRGTNLLAVPATKDGPVGLGRGSEGQYSANVLSALSKPLLACNVIKLRSQTCVGGDDAQGSFFNA